MLHEQGPAAGVTHIRLSDVVKQAGLTTGAAYRLWDDQAAFHSELAIVAVRWRDRESTAKTAQRIRPVLESGAPWQELIRVGAKANLQSFPEDAAFLTTLALRASAYGQSALIEASHLRHLDAMQSYAELYAVVMTAYSRRFRIPYAMEHLCSAFAALAEGFGVQAASGEPHPEIQLPSDDPRIGTEWTLLGLAAVALIEKMTEPA
jgi:AcrR family transcriptional regulator